MPEHQWAIVPAGLRVGQHEMKLDSVQPRGMVRCLGNLQTLTHAPSATVRSGSVSTCFCFSDWNLFRTCTSQNNMFRRLMRTGLSSFSEGDCNNDMKAVAAAAAQSKQQDDRTEEVIA